MPSTMIRVAHHWSPCWARGSPVVPNNMVTPPAMSNMTIATPIMAANQSMPVFVGCSFSMVGG